MDTVNSGLLIFCVVAELRNSVNQQNPAKFTRDKIPQNSPVLLSNTYLYNIFQNFTCKFTCCKLTNLSLNFVTETSNNVLKLSGIDYVAKNWALIAMMLKALPFNFATGSILESIVVERANDYLC